MIEGRLDFIDDKEKYYAVRVCPLVANLDVPLTQSVIKTCEGCDSEVWYNPRQMIPVVRGITFEREVIICMPCMLMHEAMTGSSPEWIG